LCARSTPKRRTRLPYRAHWSALRREISDVFFDELGIPKPDHHLGAGGGSHAQQTARVMVAFEGLCETTRPDAVVVVGDVNSTLACSVVAKKLCVPVAHVLGPNISLLPPLAYMEFLNLWKDAAVVLTDSGGIQEETTALGVPCVTLRETTERPVTVSDGTNALTGIDPLLSKLLLRRSCAVGANGAGALG
jgi:UDP-N-acetylglucosamine 2-epimerase